MEILKVILVVLCLLMLQMHSCLIHFKLHFPVYYQRNCSLKLYLKEFQLLVKSLKQPTKMLSQVDFRKQIGCLKELISFIMKRYSVILTFSLTYLDLASLVYAQEIESTYWLEKLVKRSSQLAEEENQQVKCISQKYSKCCLIVIY